MLIHPAIINSEDFSNLSHSEQLVLLKIIPKLNNKTGIYYRKLLDLSMEIGYSVKRLKQMLKKLHSTSWLDWTPGLGRSNFTKIQKGDKMSTFYEKNGDQFRIKKPGKTK